jgi:hypothetical protein
VSSRTIPRFFERAWFDHSLRCVAVLVGAATAACVGNAYACYSFVVLLFCCFVGESMLTTVSLTHLRRALHRTASASYDFQARRGLARRSPWLALTTTQA